MQRIGAGGRLTYVTVGSAALVRWMIALGGYSGEGNPPMHGDYEAQRHWMELTLHLAPAQWYYYDLPYWGLDYPPITAYVSWICGWLGSQINPDWFALEKSRGCESPSSRVFMRATVLALDLAIYIPCIVMFCRRWFAYRSLRTQELAIITLLLQPALIPIDHGHFQYNSVMLGLSLYAILCFREGKDLLGAVAFVCSMTFKQMALYYAPAVFGYLFGKCLWLGWQQGRALFIGLAVVSTVTLLSTLLPFVPPLSPFPDTLLQVVHRIFPVARGLFEDKVANFWCASDPIIHWRRRMSNDMLVRFSGLVTIASAALPMLHLLRVSWTAGGRQTRNVPSPALHLLPWAMYNSAMAFFLFSFQVHEKSILLPLLPLTLLLGDRGSEAEDGDETWEWGVLVNNVGVLTMWPLLSRDGQGMNYFLLLLLWNYVIGYNPLRISSGWFLRLLSIFPQSSYLLLALLHIIEIFSPPARYPDLWVVARVAVGCGVFGLSWLWALRKQVEVGWGLGGFQKSDKPKGTVGKEK
ncbi:ALG6 ALG8 glycosyltransferase [Dacryopinax primogenitus]|uniref:Alpha-1,3-glucosyltransferase n=1 Tax=Dacryopinax primogenitus (strain DJM 731) TaxID=1858805 RepID=M5GBA7_DACPD|nr:ALG6 ALG8 glycosyltransferase [Dacryopinax primogenitus]EJU03327.1 ALG6 ALG8 glycosyltransferase [Dacryopinax primogenitus]